MVRAMDKLVSALTRLFNLALLVAGALAGLVTAFVVFSYLYEYFTETVPARQVKVAKFMVKYKECNDPEYPLAIIFKNDSSRTVLSINFQLEAYYPGRSTNLAKYDTWTDDFIRKPGDKAIGNCWRVPELDSPDIKHSDVEYKVRITSVRFED